MKWTKPSLWIALLSCAAFALSACSSLSARHLETRAWKPGQRQELVMKFWRFEFTDIPAGTRYGVKGAAYPLTENLPGWVRNLESLTLTAYLKDRNGAVLDSDTQEYLPMPVDPDRGVAFDFFLDPGKHPSSSALSISFGYRAMFTSKDKAGRLAGAVATIPDSEIFFAEEGALIKY
jgi:hypothetical protein